MHRIKLFCFVLLLLACCARAQEAAPSATERLDRQFQARWLNTSPGACQRLPRLWRRFSARSPKVSRCTNCSAWSMRRSLKTPKPRHIWKRRRLKPGSASARMNLAINLVQTWKIATRGSGVQEGSRARAAELRRQSQSGRTIRFAREKLLLRCRISSKPAHQSQRVRQRLHLALATS